MTIVSLPNTTFNILPAQTNVGNYPHRVLLVGVMGTGTATSGAITTNIGSAGEEDALFGANSHLAMMIRNFRLYNKITPIDAVGYSNSGGTAAAGTIAFSGTATASGSITVRVGSQLNHTYTLTVASGTTATTVGASLVSALGADARAPVTGINTTGSVALTAVNKGTVGNNLTLEVLNLPAGITCTITAMANGATDPTITGLEALIDDIRYQGIVFPGTWDTAAINTIMKNRLNVTNKILDGVAILCKVDSSSNLGTWVAALNNPLLVGFGEPLVNRTSLKGAAHREFADGIAARFAAIRALRLTDGANIANFVIGTNNGLDQFGGAHTASLPYFNTPITGLPLITRGDGFSRTTVETLKNACVSVIGNNIANNESITGEILSTYKTDAAGNPNKSFKYLEYVDTITQVREYFWNNCRAKYAQTRLTEGALVPGYTMANADSIKAYMVALYNDLAEIALVQEGEQAIKYFKQNLTVTLDMEEGQVFANMNVPVVVQLRTILANIRIAFSTNQ